MGSWCHRIYQYLKNIALSIKDTKNVLQLIFDFLEISYLDILILRTLKWRQIFKLILRTITIRHNTTFSVQVTFSFTIVYSVWDNSKFYTQLWFKYVFCFDG